MSDIQQPSYYTNIPASVRYDKDIPANAKLLYGEIGCLSNKYGYCFAKNDYFANLYDLSEDRISRLIHLLEKKGYIEITIVRNEQNFIINRQIKLLDPGLYPSANGKNNEADGKNTVGKSVKIPSSNGKNNEININTNNIKTLNTNTNNTLSAQSSSEADSNSESSSSNQSANPISLAEREELRKKDEEIKELKAFVSEQKKVIESMKKEIKNKDSKPVKQTKTRKTKTDEELQTLFSDFSESDIQITANCINNFITVKQRNDSRFMRTRNQLDNWSYELLLFSKTQNRDLNEVATVWNWAINDHFWSSNINSVSAFTKKYETLIQKCNSRQNRGYQSRPKYNAIDFENQNYNEIF